jgi:hypothetical protein
MQGEEVARQPWQANRAGEDIESYTRTVASDQALDGEVLSPTKIPRPVMSAADETVLGARIRAEHEAGERSAKEAVRRYRRCGDLLAQAKDALGHGHFGPFLARTGIKPRSAQVYMQLAREYPKLPAAKANRVAQ